MSAPEAAAEAASDARTLPFLAGLFTQTLLWTLVILGLVFAVLLKVEVREFRYVGF